MSSLVILQNVGKFAETNTWHQEVDGVKLLTNTVNTVRRIGLIKHGNEAIPMQVEQSLLLHSTGSVLAPLVGTKTDRPLYTKLEDGSTTRELRADGNRHGAVLPAGYAGETTFKFKFNITCARDVSGCDSNTLLRLRYNIVGHPEIFVETEPFRLVAKEDKSRVARAAANAANASAGSRLPTVIQKLTEAKHLLEAEIGTHGNDATVLGDCQQKLTYVVAQINQLSSGPSNAAAVASPVRLAREDAPTPDTTMEDEQSQSGWSGDELNDALGDVLTQDAQLAKASPSSAEAVALMGVDDMLGLLTDDEADQLQLRSLSGVMTQQQPKRQRLAAAALDANGDEPMAFRSCAAPGDADDAPPMMRGLSDMTEAAPPAAAVAATPLHRLQSLLRGAAQQAKSDSPSAKVRARLAAIVQEVLSRHKAQQAFDLAETLDELNDLKEFLAFNGD